MGRHSRGDTADSWHHVMNRGMAKRTVFESDLDMRFFLSRLAWEVHAGKIEVHAYCIMTIHFHLLVQSPKGELSEAMRVVQNDYVRWFNRGRGRDGSLFRGRFRSKPVDSIAYRRALVRYIDFNPVRAGLVAIPSLYPHGSARWYALRRRPVWLTRSWIEASVCELTDAVGYEPRDYPERFGGPPTTGLTHVVERRIELQAQGTDPLDELVGAPSDRVLAWMRNKALLADGTPIHLPVCDPEVVCALLAVERSTRPHWTVYTSRRSTDAWLLIELALLRELCAATWMEVGVRVELTDKGAAQGYRRHAQVLDQNPEYAEVVAKLARASIDACHAECERHPALLQGRHTEECGSDTARMVQQRA